MNWVHMTGVRWRQLPDGPWHQGVGAFGALVDQVTDAIVDVTTNATVDEEDPS